MDTLRVEDFSFDDSVSVTERIAFWKKRKLWFYKIEPALGEGGCFTAADDRGRYISMTDGTPVKFCSEELAQKIALTYNDDAVKIRQAFCKVQTKGSISSSKSLAKKSVIKAD